MSREPDWDRFSDSELLRSAAAHRWHIVGLLREIKNLLSFIGILLLIAVAKYIGIVDWLESWRGGG